MLKLTLIFRFKGIGNLMKKQIDLFISSHKIDRKIAKLKRDPKLFVRDMALKNKIKFEKYLPKIKYKSDNTYTVVTAVYNTGEYLNDFFESITNQTLVFEKSIKIICVDDGSTDNSRLIIEKWINKYPNNISYFYKENGGQASARNLGLEYVDTDWVTFIDSDDFLNLKYFESVDKVLTENIDLVCCNQIYFFEKDNNYIDRHPLNYRFKKEAKEKFSAKDLESNIQFSAPLSFFKVKKINKKLKFDERLKPTFEDGKFVNSYLLELDANSEVFFCKDALYFNRKREDLSSTMDNAWNHKGQYSDVIEFGYLELLNTYKKEIGFVPRFIQRTILWELLRIIKHTVDNEQNVNFLTSDEKLKCLNLMKEAFSFIEPDTILNFELGNCGFSRQIGMLGCFKNFKPNQQVVYIENIDVNLKLMLVRYFTYHEVSEDFIFNNKKINPITIKSINRKIMGEKFLTEKRIWLPIREAGDFKAIIDGNKTRIHYLGKKYNERVQLNFDMSNNWNNIWLFMDRDDLAGDNAESLYHYVSKNINIKSYFILDKESKDWSRLLSLGFNLVEYGSEQHKYLLGICDLILSSHVGNILDPFNVKNSKRKVIFLQHGVTKDDVSKWLNNTKFDFMITATKNEYESIANNDSKYLKSELEVFLTGFPRFDKLLNSSLNVRNEILFMPTWRKSLTGNFVSKESSKRLYNDKFTKSNYFKNIMDLLKSRELEDFCNIHNLTLVFCPHPNIQSYLKEFNVLKEHIRFKKDEENIADLLVTSKVLLTDYSSVAFDFAYMKKPIVYFQFDEKQFFEKDHTYSKGYYDYRKQGFGKVVDNYYEVVVELHNIKKNHFLLEEKYVKIIEETFEKFDNKNSERVFNVVQSYLNGELLNIENLNYMPSMSTDSLVNYLMSMDAYEEILRINDECNIKVCNSKLIDIYIKLNRYKNAYDIILSDKSLVELNDFELFKNICIACMVADDYLLASKYFEIIFSKYNSYIDRDLLNLYLINKVSNSKK